MHVPQHHKQLRSEGSAFNLRQISHCTTSAGMTGTELKEILCHWSIDINSTHSEEILREISMHTQAQGLVSTGGETSHSFWVSCI